MHKNYQRGLTRARRSQAALALDPIPAAKVQSDPLEIAEFDKHNCLQTGQNKHGFGWSMPARPMAFRCFGVLEFRRT
jgi:hypothetical protein